MRQGDGTDLLGANDPRSATIGVIYVAPNDDRQSVLTAILTQDRLDRKLVVVVLPGQNDAFSRPVDFDGLRNMRRTLKTQVIFVAPQGSRPAELARQRQFPVFASLAEYTQTLQTQEPAPSNPASISRTQAPPPILIERKPTLPPVIVPALPLGAPPAPDAVPAPIPSTPVVDEEDDHGDQVQMFPILPPSPGTFASGPSSPVQTPSVHDAPGAAASVPDADVDDAKVPTAPLGADISEPSHGDEDESDKYKYLAPAPMPAPVPIRRAVPLGNVGMPIAPGTGSTQPSSTWGSAPPPPPTRGNTARGTGGVPPRRRRRTGLRWLIAILLILLVLLIAFVGVAYFAPSLLGPLANIVPGVGTSSSPAAMATITITPNTRQVKNTYIVTAITDVADPLQRQVQARQLSFTSPTQSKTVKTTGMAHISATEAKGTLTFYNALRQDQTVSLGTVLTDANGVQIITDQQIVLPAATLPIASMGVSLAHAAQTGASGNISALDFNISSCCALLGVFVQNADPFSGGADIVNYTYVQQSDIDGAANTLQTSLTQSAQTGLKKELHSGEQFIADAQCVPNIVADSSAGNKADHVMVTVSVTCTGEVYDQGGALTLAANLLKKDQTVDPGKDFALTGNVVTKMTQAMLLDPKKGTISVMVEAAGLWAYQFSNAQLLVLKQVIVGKSQSDANAALLNQPGVDKANIQISGGDGTTLPTDLSQITLLVLQVPGLKTIPTVAPTATPTPSAVPTGEPSPSPTIPSGTPTATETPTPSSTATPLPTPTPAPSPTP